MQIKWLATLPFPGGSQSTYAFPAENILALICNWNIVLLGNVSGADSFVNPGLSWTETQMQSIQLPGNRQNRRQIMEPPTLQQTSSCAAYRERDVCSKYLRARPPKSHRLIPEQSMQRRHLICILTHRGGYGFDRTLHTRCSKIQMEKTLIP